MNTHVGATPARKSGGARGPARVFAALIAAVSVAAAAAPSAAPAAPAVPGAEPVVLTFPAGEFCAFPIEVTLLDGTRLHKDGSRLFSTGPLSVTVTNLDTGVAATFNASGPTFADGTLTGTALIGQPASRNVGPAFLIINRGRVTFTANSTINTITGSQIDICAALT
jgi:hypothetical protein